MSKNRGTKIFTSDTPDKLFAEFVREMDEHSTNGVVKNLDPAKIEPLVDHFLEQCDHFEDKVELRDRIQILLTAKFNYALAEERLSISTELEKSIHEKIKDVIKVHFENAAKFAGFILNWTILKPIKFMKTVVEPVIANTVLTYSIAVHPPYLDSVEIRDLNAIMPAHGENVEVVKGTDNKFLERELEMVKKYSDEDLANLTQNTIQSGNVSVEKKGVSVEKVKTSSAAMNTNISRENDKSQNVNVNLHRRIIQRSSATINTPQNNNISVNRYAGELRPIGDVQRIIAQNDYRIFNCFNVHNKNSAKKNGRISVKFQISSRGMVKDVKVTYNSFSQDIADRVTLQVKTVRFTEVDPKLGDQTVYHTFYF